MDTELNKLINQKHELIKTVQNSKQTQVKQESQQRRHMETHCELIRDINNEIRVLRGPSRAQARPNKTATFHHIKFRIGKAKAAHAEMMLYIITKIQPETPKKIIQQYIVNAKGEKIIPKRSVNDHRITV